MYVTESRTYLRDEEDAERWTVLNLDEVFMAKEVIRDTRKQLYAVKKTC